MIKNICLIVGLLFSNILIGQSSIEDQALLKSTSILPKVIEWRRYLHEHPELGNREIKTAEYIASHLKEWGIEVTTGVGKTGVV